MSARTGAACRPNSSAAPAVRKERMDVFMGVFFYSCVFFDVSFPSCTRERNCGRNWIARWFWQRSCGDKRVRKCNQGTRRELVLLVVRSENRQLEGRATFKQACSPPRSNEPRTCPRSRG